MTDEKQSKSARLKEIVRVFNKYDVLPSIVRQVHPEKVRQAFEELGPTFVKVGQMLSVRPDIVTPAFGRELQKLQDDVRTDTFEEVKRTIEEDTGKHVSDIYAEFEELPFASASMGQTHRAVLKTGEKVAVKIQHPNIHDKILTDLSLFEQALPLIKRFPQSNVINPKEILREIKHSLLNEINSVQEAINGEEFYHKNNGKGIIESPIIYSDYCTERILVAEFKEGKSMNIFLEDIRKSEKNIQASEGVEIDEQTRKKIGDALLESFVKQVFDDGFFHADPHPGNVLIRKVGDTSEVHRVIEVTDGLNQRKRTKKEPSDWAYKKDKTLPPYRIVFLDFGMMGRLDEIMMDKLTKVVMAIITKDTQEIGNAVLNLCNKTGPYNRDNFFEELEPFLNEYYDMPMRDMDFRLMFTQILSICHHHNLQTPQDIAMLMKAFITVEGIVEELNPKISMMEVALAFAKNQIKEKFDVKEELQDVVMELLMFSRTAPRVPKKMVDALDTLAKGRAKINIDVKESKPILHHVDRMVNKVVIGVVLGALIIGMSILGTTSIATSHGLFSSLSKILIIGGILFVLTLLIDSLIKKRKTK